MHTKPQQRMAAGSSTERSSTSESRVTVVPIRAPLRIWAIRRTQPGAPFADMIGVSRQATVLAFQFGDGFTNMITPCSGVLMAVLSVAKIPYEKWVRFIWKFIVLLIAVGFLLLLPTLYMNLSGF